MSAPPPPPPPPRRPTPSSIGSGKKRSRPAPQAVDQLGKRKKPKDMPRRPLSAYNMYFQEERKKTIAKYEKGEEQDDFLLPPGKDPSEALFQAVSRTVANRWKAMTEAQRKPFYDRAQAEMNNYRKKMDEYNQKMIDSSTLAQRLAETQREQLAESKILTEQLERERRTKQSGGGVLTHGYGPLSAPPSSSTTTTETAPGSIRSLLDSIPDGNRAVMLASTLQQDAPPSMSAFAASPNLTRQEQELLSGQPSLQRLLLESFSRLPTTVPRLQHDLSNFRALSGGTISSLYSNNSDNNSKISSTGAPIASTMVASQYPSQLISQQGNGQDAIQQLLRQQLARQQQTQTTNLEALVQELVGGNTQQRRPVPSFPSLQHPSTTSGSTSQYSSSTHNAALLRMLQLERLLGLPSSVLQPQQQQQQQQIHSSDLGHFLKERPELIQLLQAAQQAQQQQHQQQQQQQHGATTSYEDEKVKWAEELLRSLSRRNP